MIWLACALLLAAFGGFLFWRIRRRRNGRMVSFVALLREPAEFDPAVLAKVAGKVWDADLGDGSSEGADGFVVGHTPLLTIKHGGRLFLMNAFPQPYVKDVEQAAQGIKDLRIRALFAEHKAWFSCDALGVNRATPESECLEWYQQLGKLFADLLDDNCLLIFLPDSALAFPINDETENALRSDDPVATLQATLTVPIVEVSDNDPLMKRAVEEARTDWPRFVAAYEERAGENFSVKAPITHEGHTEFIWISVTAIEGDSVYGTLGNDPGRLGSLKFGSKVCVPVAELNDWCYMDPKGKLTGGFTIEVVKNAQNQRRPR